MDSLMLGFADVEVIFIDERQRPIDIAIALHPLSLSDEAWEAFVAGEAEDLREGMEEEAWIVSGC